ncbi:MAG: DUF2173 family protein [Gammaproteobacteria bacterium]
MQEIEDILRVEGVLAAGEFSQQGQLLGFKTNQGFELSESQAAEVAASCAKAHAAMQGFGEEMSEHLSDTWNPPVGWMYAAGKYTVAIGNGFGVFVDSFSVDFNDLFNAIAGSR